MRLIYLDAGSGALQPVPPELVTCVRAEIDLPLIVGGGIRTPERAAAALEAGADMVVVGNALERNSDWLPELAAAVRSVGEFVARPQVQGERVQPPATQQSPS